MTTFIPLTVFLTKSFTANKIYLHGARSGFEPESPVTLRWFGVTAPQLKATNTPTSQATVHVGPNNKNILLILSLYLSFFPVHLYV